MDFLIGIVLLVLALAVIGFFVYLIITYIKMPEIFQQVIQVAVAILLVLYLIGLLLGRFALPTFPLGRG